jgi:peptide/nickel transport system permease protein
MGYYIRKVSGFFFTLFLVSVMTFMVFQVLPGNPAVVILGVDADPAQIEALQESLHLDKPVLIRYGTWVNGVLNGDLGLSFRYQKPVADIIANGLPVTATIGIVTLLLTVCMGLPMGLWLAKHNESRFSIPFSLMSQLGLSIPSFCMGILLISIFTVRLRWFPSIGYTPWSQNPIACIQGILMPSFSLALATSAVLVRYLRVSILSQYKQDYVRTARSKGLNEQFVLYRHILRNSLIPVITILGMMVADVLGGSIIIENVFSLPGIGKLISTSIATRDLPLIQGLVLYLACMVVASNFLVDLLYSLIDPRIHLK